MKIITQFGVMVALLLMAACHSEKAGAPTGRDSATNTTEPRPAPDIAPWEHDREYAQKLASIDPKEISDAAIKTLRAYRQRGDHFYQKVEPDCWDERIKRLNPVRVYVHQLNLAIVLKRDERQKWEYGIYFCDPISSFCPPTGTGQDRSGYTWCAYPSEKAKSGFVTFTRDLQTDPAKP